MNGPKVLAAAAKRLLTAQNIYRQLIDPVMEENGIRSHLISLQADDAASKAYRRLEGDFVRTYNGTSSVPGVVWSAIQNGEAFPAYPYSWLPAGDYAVWWDIEKPAVRKLWVEYTLSQAGWKLDVDSGEWTPPQT